MADEPNDPAAPPAEPAAPPKPPVVPPGAHVKTDAAPEAPDAAELAKLRDELNRARKDAAAYREKARDAESKSARLPEVLKALGLETEETDPAKLAEAAQKERDAARAELAAARREAAVFRLAASAGAEPGSLLDSRTFMDKVATIDPADTDALTEAIKAAVTANPRLAATAAPAPPPPAGGASGGDFSGGPGAGQQLSRAQLHSMSNEEIMAAYEAGRLNAVMRS